MNKKILFAVSVLFLSLILCKPAVAHGAKIIKDDATGGDCVLIGSWDSTTKTCALNTDLNDNYIEIGSNNIILDGNDHTLTGNWTIPYGGVYLYKKTGVIIKNINIKNFNAGVQIRESNNNTVINVNGENNSYGIVLYPYSSDNLIKNNTFSYNTYFGVHILFYSNNNKIYNNNFISNEIYPINVEKNNCTGNIFYIDPPVGGNYYDNFDEPLEGCIDMNNDGFCDSPYVFYSGQDNFPLAQKQNWNSKEAPLYTQIRSPYPSDDETKIWAELDYAEGPVGNYNCGYKISQCGCALTSAVMVLKYYNIEADPKNLNIWLNNNNGYGSVGNVNWSKITEYSGNKIKYDNAKSGDYLNNYALLDEYLNKNQPAIAKEKAGRGGFNRNHFIVTDNKLTDTYGVKDPAWYNTKKLNETTDIVNKIRGYDNGFDGLRLFYPSDGIAESSISLTLGSPAELLIIDSLGRRLGKDPVSGNVYNEIPNGSYITDAMDDPFSDLIAESHESKSIYIGNPAPGGYDIRVIGIGLGQYSLDSLAYDNNGVSYSQSFLGTTNNGIQVEYNLNFTPDNPELMEIKVVDNIQPWAKIYFDAQNKKLKVDGFDNISQNPVVEKQGNNFIITDEAGNSLNVSFSELAEGKSGIRAILQNANMHFGWSTDNKTGQIRRLDQRIDTGDLFKVRARYDGNNTGIEIGSGNQVTKEEVPGLAIVKLIVKSSGLDFEIEK